MQQGSVLSLTLAAISCSETTPCVGPVVAEHCSAASPPLGDLIRHGVAHRHALVASDGACLQRRPCRGATVAEGTPVEAIGRLNTAAVRGGADVMAYL